VSVTLPDLQPGQRARHREFGEGVVVEAPRDGFVRVFFPGGERHVPVGSLAVELSRNERILGGVTGTADRLREVWLSAQAHALPLMDGAAALTAAKIDLLPHQVVLTHRIATASPRRFLVADEVGLGKTIETALLLRELESRGELTRALMVVPAGLVNNWHRELNEVFHLDFEVFGSEGDVTDRKSNAFARHDRLIASIDTLKRPARVRRLLEAPPWDLVVFDEAHHLTAYRSGKKVRKTENFKLAEALKNHTRDLLLLSATPHQGDHFRFWMLVQLLNPTLFKSHESMVDQRHRLNAVVMRRTKADSCRADGSALFARRLVHTESFLMSNDERRFYEELRRYLEDGFALAKRQGQQGSGLGFVMAVFQKIAASSFAAVKRTLRRRLLALTIHEGILRDQDLDIDGRETLYREARELIREEHGLGDDPISRGQVDRILADTKLKLLKTLDQEELDLLTDPHAWEGVSARAEDLASAVVASTLPQERDRIKALLALFPPGRETKADKLLQALGALWRHNPGEKVVVFATYLGTVDMLAAEVEVTYPGQGVVVLKGGDHGAKLAAERRFKRRDGPKMLVCTAAGREGINLQTSRVLFNFDLPWNPMDVEQRIGRIHRYGQAYTAQVYNLVLSDTIEGRVFLLLDSKLTEIARAVGKVDEQGNVAEDLRSQILGQLAERLNYERLYQEALSDPELKRTRLELESALANADEARKVVFELFQDLERFNLADYRPLADPAVGMNRLILFLTFAVETQGMSFGQDQEGLYSLRSDKGQLLARFTTDRDVARDRDDVQLLGLDHPNVVQVLQAFQDRPAEELGASVQAKGIEPGVLTWWLTEAVGPKGERRRKVVSLGATLDGRRHLQLENLGRAVLELPATPPRLLPPDRDRLLRESIEPMLEREIKHHASGSSSDSYSLRLIGWIEAT